MAPAWPVAATTETGCMDVPSERVDRRFRFGVIGEGIGSGDQLLAEARRAEELGYATLLLRDHFVAEPYGDQLAPLVALTAAACATTTLHLGSFVLDNDYRHPVLLAKEAATLDQLSGGRLELGIGAGWLSDEYGRAGIPFDAPGVRVSRLEESLRVLKGLLSGSALTFAGEHYTISDLTSFPKPLRQPHPPILVGAGGRRMLALAGREADIVGVLPSALPDDKVAENLAERSPAAYERKVGWIREAAGERFGEVELSLVVSVVIADDHREAAERFAAERGWGSEAADLVLGMPSVLVGSPDRIAEQMLARRERFGFSYYVVSDEQLDCFSPVVERLAGR
jgi:probable F420-dependent oxidoreductase